MAADEEKGGEGAGGGAADSKLDGGTWFAHLQSLGNAVEVEVAQVQRRYGRTFKTLSEAPLTFEIEFHSSDPDFKFAPLPGDCVFLNISLPDGYPAEPVSVAVSDKSAHLGAGAARAIAAGVARWAAANRGRKMLRPLLKWLDKNLEELLVLGRTLDERAAGKTSSASATAAPAERSSGGAGGSSTGAAGAAE